MSEGKKFVARVEELLAQGKVYQPATEFVRKLGIAVPDPETLKGLLIRMVTLAMEELTRWDSKQAMTNWLREAAKTLDDLELMERDWISRNVRQLPQRPNGVIHFSIAIRKIQEHASF